MTPPAALVVHSVPGRARLRVPSLRGQAAGLDRLVRSLRSIPGVREVRANPTVGSLLVLHQGELAALLAAAQERGLFQIDRAPTSTAMPLELVASEGARLDGLLRRASRGSIDLPTAAFAVLVGAGVVQAVKGRVWGPTSTLWWTAINLAVSQRAKSSRGT